MTARAALSNPSNLATALENAALAFPEGIAVVDEDRELTYSELLARALEFAGFLRRAGVARGDIVTVQLPNWWETQVAAYGTWLSGAVYNPVVSIYREAELRFIVEQARSKVLVVPSVHRDHDYRSVATRIAATVPGLTVVVTRPDSGDSWDGHTFDQALQSVDSPEATTELAIDDLAVLLYTSGSTAAPKGALHSHRSMLHEARQVADIARLDRDDVVFMPSPLTHVTGVAFGTVLPALIGVPSVLQDRWDPALAADRIERHRCTFTVSATPFLLGLTKIYEERRLSCSLKVFICGGAEIGPALVRRARASMGTHVVRCYGSTEFPTFCIGDPYGDPDVGADTDGLPVPLSSYRLDTEGWSDVPNTGEILIKGAELFLGYLDSSLDANAFDEDGYFRTGDVVHFDERGACSVVGRKKDIIIRGGENLSAIEIEDCLLQHPGITDAAVVAMPDSLLGEKACAFLVVSHPEGIGVAELRDFVVGRGLAIQKAPERVELVDELPRTASGKVQKYLLRERVRTILSST